MLLIESVQISVKETGLAKVMITCLQRKKVLLREFTGSSVVP